MQYNKQYAPKILYQHSNSEVDCGSEIDRNSNLIFEEFKFYIDVSLGLPVWMNVRHCNSFTASHNYTYFCILTF